jgi:hypothetical protein
VKAEDRGGQGPIWAVAALDGLMVFSKIKMKYSSKNKFYVQKLLKLKAKMFTLMFILDCMMRFLCRVQ